MHFRIKRNICDIGDVRPNISVFTTLSSRLIYLSELKLYINFSNKRPQQYQGQDGTVWYFGEIARNYEEGELVDIEGSWVAGVDGAKAGILMPASPSPGQIYRQEYA